MTDKITVYRDGRMYYIPTNIVRYDGLIEVNGSIIDPKGTPYITAASVKSIRLVSKEMITVAYVYDDESMTAKEYDERLYFLSHTFKEKIDERFDDEGDKQNVCIWKDKEAEKEYYMLTNKYQRRQMPMFTYADVDFEIVDLPKSDNPYIIPDWKVSPSLVLTCTFTRTAMMEGVVKEYTQMSWCKGLKVQNYLSGSSCIYINETKYSLEKTTGNVTRGSYKDCLAAYNTIAAQIDRWFKIEAGKLNKSSPKNVGVILEDINSIIRTFNAVKPKVATSTYYNKGMAKLDELKRSLEEEVIS